MHIFSDFITSTIDANRKLHSAILNSEQSDWAQRYSIGAGGDVSLGIDLFAQDIFHKHLDRFGIIDSEESGILATKRVHKNRIIIDPIDGSANFHSRFPYYGTSVAIFDEKNHLCADEAVVCNLANAELIIKDEDENIFEGSLYGKEFTPPRVVDDAPIGIFEKAYAYPKIGEKLIKEGYKYRVAGAVALSFAYARRVEFVLFVGSLRRYDLDAALAICKDLEVIVEKDYVIVSKRKQIAKKIQQIVCS